MAGKVADGCGAVEGATVSGATVVDDVGESADVGPFVVVAVVKGVAVVTDVESVADVVEFARDSVVTAELVTDVVARSSTDDAAALLADPEPHDVSHITRMTTAKPAARFCDMFRRVSPTSPDSCGTQSRRLRRVLLSTRRKEVDDRLIEFIDDAAQGKDVQDPLAVLQQVDHLFTTSNQRGL